MHDGVDIAPHPREKLERLCRDVSRPPVAVPRMHLTRFHGVFAPHSKLRAAVTPAYRGLGCAHLQRIVPEQYGSDLPLGARTPPVRSRLL